ncbi:hypothetical protein SAMN05444365_10295 [Micromonospora pattaloongensis]|uniref:Tetratricopeptide repeat-containing protein n=1 Tax=Micromonospora pattaloongensis TaxID=405436 RepID=A0A1H3JFK6_9ACTN|nr:hypothetical protein [Micromonospora pattaloongensis]SDY38701.1 hypothetical protein SAMN05444365_10295 [Micromonospora pattaloongensis]
MWRSFQERHRERQALQLLEQAQQERTAGRGAEALRTQLDAVELIRGLADAHPGDPRHQQAIASALYTLASLQSQAGQPAAALAALAESEQLYRQLGDAGEVDAAPLVADVRVRRACTLMVQGRGASAVPEVDAAVTTYAELYELDDGNTLRRDLSRVLAMNAVVLARFGDPDLACGSADTALRIYLSTVVSPGTFMVHSEDTTFLRHAAAVSAAVHVQHRRIEMGLVAANVALQLGGGGDTERLRHVRSLAANVGRLTPAELDALDREFTRSLHVVTQSAPPSGSDVDRLARTGLAQALGAAGAAGATLADTVTRPAVDCEIIFPAQRCHPQLAAARARELGELALATLPVAPIDGLRIALEAHYLYAAASRARATALRTRIREDGPVWARTLLAAASGFELRGDLPMALDLAAWAAGAAQQLMPFVTADRGVAALVRDCVEQHGRLLAAAGDRNAGDEALSAARGLADLIDRA